MIETDSGNRSQTQGGSREGDAERSSATNRRPYEQKQTERPRLSDECASKHEIQKLNKAAEVESEGAAGKLGALPRETSTEATASGEESAEVVVGGWTFLGKDLQEMERIRNAEGPKSQGDDLNPHSVSPATAPQGARSGGLGKQKWLPGLWLPHGETGQAAAASSEPGDGRKEERKEQAPGLMEKIVSDENAALALLAVERNGGAAGIDGMGTEQLRPHLEKHWLTIRRKLLEGTYVPSPVKRVWIPKGNGGERPLGIPTVLDRYVQQLILGELQPLFERVFSEQSWGFRPGRGAHDAVRSAQRIMTQEGKSWVVDMDIKGFFDHVDHDILMRQVGLQVRDKRVLKLIGRCLRAGVWEEGRVSKPEGKGTPQGGPLSPLLANIYLDVLDKELEQRGLSFSRYADDCNIYVRTERAAQRVLESITKFVAQKLKLEVSASKSGVDRPWKRKFLGFRLSPEGVIEVSEKAIEKLRDRVHEFWESRQNKNSTQLRDQWQRYIRGWWEYYRLAGNCKPLLWMDGWIRRHMRKCFWQRWHGVQGRLNALRKLGVRNPLLRGARSGRGAWRMAKHPVMNKGLSNRMLRRYGFLCFADLMG
jgi:RNA-directed DNA polymerase